MSDKWLVLQSKFEDVMKDNSRLSRNVPSTHVSISYDEFAVVYQLVLEYCVNEDAMEDLYQRLSNFFKKCCAHLLVEFLNDRRQGDFSFAQYLNRFENYKTSVKYINGMCNFLNRYWICRKNFETIYVNAINTWSHAIISQLIEPLTASILQMYATYLETKAVPINTAIISHLSEMKPQFSMPKDNWFVLHVLPKVLVDTYNFHRKLVPSDEHFIKFLFEVPNMFLDCSFTMYKTEIKTAAITAVVWDVLPQIEDEFHRQLALYDSDKSLTDEKMHNFSTLYSVLFYAETRGLYSSSHLKQTDGCNVFKPCDTIIFENKAHMPLHEHFYRFLLGLTTGDFEFLVAFYSKYQTLVNRAFFNDSKFKAALDKAFKQIVDSAPDVAAHLARFLAEGNDGAVVLKFVSDKDVFESHYLNIVAQRLINGKEVDITAVQNETCFAFNLRLQTMIKDVVKSQTDHPNVLVCRNSVWPMQVSSLFQNFIAPAQILAAVHSFSLSYFESHPNVKLIWLWNKCKGKLKSNCFHREYQFKASMVQIAILSLFNDALEVSLETIKTVTGLDPTVLKPNLDLLVKMSLCKWTAGGNVELNLSYKYKKVLVNIDQPVKLEAQKSEVSVTEDRMISTQATIMRILKSKRSITHVDLMSDLITILSARFQPSVPLMKKALEILIEKEFVQRHAESRDVYVYVA